MPGSLDGYRTTAMVCVLLVAAVALVFGQTLGHGFVNYDDKIYVFENEHVTGGLTVESIVWSFTHGHCCNWHPLTWLSHMLDCHLHGLKAGGHHATSLLLHAATVVLLFLVLRQMTGRWQPSAWVAAVFAIHPLRAESVAWVAERKDVLSGLFFMLTLAAYAGYARRRFSLARYLAVVIVFALGLMAKPMLVTLPLLLLLLDYWPLARFSNPGQTGNSAENSRRAVLRVILEKIPLLAFSAASCMVTCLAQVEAIQPVDRIALPLRMANTLVSYVSYLGCFFYPARLAVFYPYPEQGLPTWEVAGSAALLIGFSVVALLGVRKCPYLAVGWFWYLGMLVPVIGLVQVGSQSMADRYTYLPQIGLGLILAYGTADLCRRWPSMRRGCSVTSVAVLAALAVRAWGQTTHWRDNMTLWTHALECTSGSLVGHYNFGLALQRAGRSDEAMQQYQKALEIQPEAAEVRYNLGLILQAKGRMKEAADIYRNVLQANPKHTDAHNNLAVILHMRGNVAEAVDHWQKALEIGPEHSEVHANLAQAFAKQGKANEAIEHYRRALVIAPSDAALHRELGNLLLERGLTDEAIAGFRRAIEIRPDYADAHNDLGAALGRLGRLEEAMVHWQAALKIDPAQAEPLQNIGSALLYQGKSAEALDQWRRAIRLSPDNTALLNMAARTLATSPDAAVRNGVEAIALARRAVELSGGRSAAYLDTLAAAYAEAGRFPEAVRHAQRALAVAAEQGDTALADAVRQRIRYYESGIPLRSPR